MLSNEILTISYHSFLIMHFTHVLPLMLHLFNHRLGGSEDDVKEIMVHPFFETINWQELVERKVSLIVILSSD